MGSRGSPAAPASSWGPPLPPRGRGLLAPPPRAGPRRTTPEPLGQYPEPRAVATVCTGGRAGPWSGGRRMLRPVRARPGSSKGGIWAGVRGRLPGAWPQAGRLAGRPGVYTPAGKAGGRDPGSPAGPPCPHFSPSLLRLCCLPTSTPASPRVWSSPTLAPRELLRFQHAVKRPLSRETSEHHQEAHTPSSAAFASRSAQPFQIFSRLSKAQKHEAFSATLVLRKRGQSKGVGVPSCVTLSLSLGSVSLGHKHRRAQRPRTDFPRGRCGLAANPFAAVAWLTVGGLPLLRGHRGWG